MTKKKYTTYAYKCLNIIVSSYTFIYRNCSEMNHCSIATVFCFTNNLIATIFTHCANRILSYKLHGQSMNFP